MTSRTVLSALLVLLAPGLSAETPSYAPERAMDNAMRAVQRPVNPQAMAERGAVDSRVLVLGSNGTWQVEKPGSRGWYQDQSTVLVAGTNGQLQVATQGTGIKDRNAPRFAGDESRVAKLLREAQAFTYARTDSWGRPEDLEKYKVGDCADKSFWLASKLQEAGFTSARVVCGIRDGAKEGHAWVEVKVNGQDMLLETTSTDAPLPLWQAKLEYYLRYPPYAAFDRSGARRLR